MKRPFPISNFRFPICRKSAASAAAHRLSPAGNHQSQKGVALIITVILLAVVTFMALTFLALSRRERGAVTTTTDATTAQLAADDALAAAEAQITANTLATTNPYDFGLLVSTNFINPAGFNSALAGYNPTNVNYDYVIGGGRLSQGDYLQNLANLEFLPRAPVYATNYVFQTNELQCYLDLNRNGVFDTNNFPPGAYTAGAGPVGDPEWIGVLQHPDQPYGPNNPFVARYAFVAVPTGNALDLNAIHNEVFDENGQRGPYVSPNLEDAYFRNQGVGSWEINLAAFLADLNANEWGRVIGTPDNGNPTYYYYQYRQQPQANSGLAFYDADALLAYRYDNVYGTLASARQLLPNAPYVFPSDGIDEYSDGPPQAGPSPINEIPPVNRDYVSLPWAGADNINHFFDPQELFNTSETAMGLNPQQIAAGNDFSARLQSIGDAFNMSVSDPIGLYTNSYNRYTYYRLLSQMGVDSAPMQDQINLNYSNAAAYFYPDGTLSNIVYYPNAETNLTPWQPLQFFTIAADRMLRAYSQEWITESPSNYVWTYGMTKYPGVALDITNPPVPFGISDIPVLVSNRFVYTPAVQRVLQLAANMYDATTNTYFPSVFRPIFEHDQFGNVFIVGYTNLYSSLGGFNTVSGASGDPQLSTPYDIVSITNLSADFKPITDANGLVNVYGVPWIIGAKKGFPNFNEFAMESAFQLTRKLQVTRDSTNDTYRANPGAFHFNQMFNLSVSNQFGVECWNSYTNYFPDTVSIYVSDASSGALSNDESFSARLTNYITGSLVINNPTNWPGYNPLAAPLTTPASFQIPLNANVTVVTNSTYRFNNGAPYLWPGVDLPYETGVDINGNLYPQPHWWLVTTNDLRVVMLDGPVNGPNHVIDYVQLSGPNSTRDLTSEIIANKYDNPAVSYNASPNELWNTNYQAGVPIGILSQVYVSDYQYTTSPSSPNLPWDPVNDEQSQNAIDAFRVFFNNGFLSPIWNNRSGQAQIAAAYMTNAMQAPYNPTVTLVQHVDWQANDPLVHYLASDLNWPGANQYDTTPADLTSLTNKTSNLGQLNTWYMPWGGHQPINTNAADFNSVNAYNLAIKDPLVWRSDDWDFPTYKLPTVGWLGRVHRGTPWQTVYLKSPDILREIQVTGGNQTNYIGPSQWAELTGDSLAVVTRNSINQNVITYYDAGNSAPVQDRLLFDLFTTAPNANATRGQLSVNVGAGDPGNPLAGLAAWSALFSGVEVLSNNAAFPLNQHNGATMSDYTAFPINPAGPGGTNSALGQIVVGINQARVNGFNTARIVFVNSAGTSAYEIPAAFENADGLRGAFEHVGDILSVPQLSDQSPFLNWNNPYQLQNGIGEEMYDWLPQQVMSLLRVSGTPQSPMRYVIYCYGQALKPAANGVYTGSQTINGNQSAFGMITNYQVVAESASRAVVNFGSVETNLLTVTNDTFGNQILNNVPVVTNNTARIQQYNLLAPY